MAFEIKRNDRRPFFVVVLKDDFGEPTESIVDLTTAGTAYFNMGTSVNGVLGAAKITRGAASITNAAGGEVTYQWGTADTNAAGSYLGEVAIVWNDGKQETFPGGPAAGKYWAITITEDIDNL